MFSTTNPSTKIFAMKTSQRYLMFVQFCGCPRLPGLCFWSVHTQRAFQMKELTNINVKLKENILSLSLSLFYSLCVFFKNLISLQLKSCHSSLIEFVFDIQCQQDRLEKEFSLFCRPFENKKTNRTNLVSVCFVI